MPTGDVSGTTTPLNEDQCQQAILAAQAATSAGTWVYSVAYGSSTATGPGSNGTTCGTDNYSNLSGVNESGISSCQTMQQIASTYSATSATTGGAKFYSDDSGGSGTCASANSYSDMVAAFTNLSSSLQEPRLLPDNTT